MLEPNASARFSVVALAASALVFTACQRTEKAPEAPPPKPAVTQTEPPAPTPVAPPVLDRAGLLQAIDAAASDYAAAQPSQGSSLAGRRFLIRQAFGCEGPRAPAAKDEPGDGLAGWSWDAAHKTISLGLTPGEWTGSPLMADGPETWEVAEGVWLTRPWLRADGCPATRGDPLASGPATSSPQTAGLAAVFESGGSRLERRNGRGYAFTLRGEDKAPLAAPTQGFRVVLEGRLLAFADGRPIRCRSSAPDQRPVCIAAAQVDRVAFENAAGAVLTEWRPG